METNRRKLLLFFGITLFTQAVTSLVGGCIFLNSFNTAMIDDAFMRMVAGSAGTAFVSITLQMVTAVVIVMLGAAMYRLAGHVNKTLAGTALILYAMEAVLLLVGQAFVYGLLKTADLYVASGDQTLISLGSVLYQCRKFCGEIAMFPFAVGAVIFYSQVTKAGLFPKWAGWYGVATAALIGVCIPLGTFGVDVPTALLIPYMPFEFAMGIYVIVKSRRAQA